MSDIRNGTGQTGYSLAELLMVVTVFVITMAFVSPPMARMQARSEVKAMVAEVSATHALARSLAVQYARITELHIDSDKDRLWIEADTTVAGDKPVKLGGREFKHGDIASDRELVCFNGRGFPTRIDDCEAPDMTVTFQFSSEHDTLRVTSVGVIRP